jgi:hypothetical protein
MTENATIAIVVLCGMIPPIAALWAIFDFHRTYPNDQSPY